MTEQKHNTLSLGCFRVIRWLVKVFYPNIAKKDNPCNIPEEVHPQ